MRRGEGQVVKGLGGSGEGSNGVRWRLNDVPTFRLQPCSSHQGYRGRGVRLGYKDSKERDTAGERRGKAWKVRRGEGQVVKGLGGSGEGGKGIVRNLTSISHPYLPPPIPTDH